MLIYERLENYDPEIDNLIKAEEKRQRCSLNLIASENFTSVSVLQASGSILTNKYSEGQIGNRYYGGNEFIDSIETVCKKRALELFNLDENIWDVNVQPLSGTGANFAVYTGLLGKDGKLMGLDLPSGGHLSHGYQTQKKKISATSIFFTSKAYKNGSNGEIDYYLLEKEAAEFKPDLIVCGGSAYPHDFDYKKFREIAGEAYLMMDMAHISGFIASGRMNNPFEYCDVVTTTTHKLLRGPRSAMIFYKKILRRNGNEVNLKSLIDFAVFPGLHGGPHNQKIAALAVALKQAKSTEYIEYIEQVYQNAQLMASEFKKHGYKLYADGTKCHLILVCLEDIGGSFVEKLCELVNISINKNCIATDKKALNPSAIRLGTPALTTRGFLENDFVQVCQFVHESILIAKDIFNSSEKNEKGTVSMKIFLELAKTDLRVIELRGKVSSLASLFPIPRFNYRL
ncbi:hypothetical protein GINT2_000618 [Glugoides intestinalis]